MAEPPFATVDDLEAFMIDRDLTPMERVKAPAQLARASAIMRARCPWLDPTPPDTAKGVCCAMVIRVLNNPRGLRSVSIDDYAQTTDSSRSTGELYLSDDEVAQLRPPGMSGAFEIRLGPVCEPQEATP